MRVFFHVGLPKTATTYLQKAVFPKIENVNAWSRPYTMLSPVWDKLQHSPYFHVESARDDLKRMINEAPGQNVLLSDEHFVGVPYKSFLNREMIARRLGDVCPEAECILFLRGQRSLISSLHNQYVKARHYLHNLDCRFIRINGEGMDLCPYRSGETNFDVSMLYHHSYGYMSADAFYYSKLIKLYEQHFSRVHIFLYEDLKANPETTLTRLADLLGGELDPSILERAKEKKANLGLQKNELWEAMFRNRLSVLRGGRGFRGIKPLSAILARLKSARLEDGRKRYLDQLMSEANYSDDNRLVNEKYNLGMERYPDAYFRD